MVRWCQNPPTVMVGIRRPKTSALAGVNPPQAKSTCPASPIHVLVPFVTPALPTAAERLARILDDLCKAVAARGPGGFLPIPLLMLVWTRIRRASIRIARLAARAAAGKPPIVRRAPRAAPQNPASRKPASRLPRRAGWLIGPVPAAMPRNCSIC